MTNYVKTFATQVNVFGGSPSTKWGDGVVCTFTMGVDKWGEGSKDLPIRITKGFTGSVQVQDAESISVDWNRSFSGSMSVAGDMTSEQIQDPAGYVRCFPRSIPDGESRIWDTTTAVADPTDIFTSAAQSATTWVTA